MTTQKQLFIYQDNAVAAVLSNAAAGACPFLDAKWLRRSIDSGGYEETLTFSVPADHADAAFVAPDNYVWFLDGTGRERNFRIVETTTETGALFLKTVECEAEFYDLGYHFLEDFTTGVGATSAEFAIGEILAELPSTGWSVGTGASAAVKAGTGYSFVSRLDAIMQIIKESGVEVDFVSSKTGAGNKVNFPLTRGASNGKRFEIGKDILGIKYRESVRGTYSHVYPLGKTGSIKLGGSLSGNASYGKRITRSDLYLVGNAIDTDDCEISSTRYGIFINDDIGLDMGGTTEMQSRMSAFSSAVASHAGKKEKTWEMSVVLLEDLAGYEHETVGFGDTVIVCNKLDGSATEARVFELEVDLTDPRQSRVVLGSTIKTTSTSIAETQKQLSKLYSRAGAYDDAAVGLYGEATVNPSSIPSGSQTAFTITVPGAAVGDAVRIFPPYSLAGLTVTAYVNAPGSVMCVLANLSNSLVDPGNGTFKARVYRDLG